MSGLSLPAIRLVPRLAISLLPFTLGLIWLVLGTVRSFAADPCLDNLPVPAPLLHRVVQLVNCSNQRVLGTANAAFAYGSPPTSVLPREKTWVMEPFPIPPGAPANANVLTIDIPEQWEDTSKKGSIGPNFWVRTGCRYDVANGIAQCETGGCSGIYDCSAAHFGPPPGATLAEWTFYQQTRSGGNTYYLDHPDISAVNGVNLNLDIQPVGGSASNPTSPDDPQWLAQNYPLTQHGADLRTPGDALGQCPAAFQLKRSDLTGVTTPPTPPGQALYAFVISDAEGVPQDPTGDGTVGCFSNCGRYEFPTAPAADCSDTSADSRCFLHNAFCLYLPTSAYNQSCNTDADCYYNGATTGSPVGTTGVGSPCAAAGASLRMQAAIQLSAPFSMAITEARLGSLRTLNAPPSPTPPVNASATILCIRSCRRRIHGRTILRSTGEMRRFTESFSRREAQASRSLLP